MNSLKENKIKKSLKNLVVILLIIILCGALSIRNSLITIKEAVYSSWTRVEYQISRQNFQITQMLEWLNDLQSQSENSKTVIKEARKLYQIAENLEEKIIALNKLDPALTKALSIIKKDPKITSLPDYKNWLEQFNDVRTSLKFEELLYNQNANYYNRKIKELPHKLISKWLAFKKFQTLKLEEV